MTDTIQNEKTQKCGYCYKERPQSEMYQYKPMHHYKQRHLDRMMWFCSDTKCGSRYQMSIEG